MSALGKLIAALLKSLLAKLAAAWLLLDEILGRLFVGAEGVADDGVRAIALLLGRSELARDWTARWLLVLLDALRTYWMLLFVLVGAGLVLVATGHLPLAWRALSAWRRAVFVSFQNEREAEAQRLASALDAARFRVLRLPYEPGAGHQRIVGTVNDMLRACDAVVCLPGRDTSFVEAEVAAATVARKPVVFLVSDRGTLPNTADKRHPSFSLERSAARDHEPVGDFLHHVTQDFRSTWQLYRAAWAHPTVSLRFFQVLVAAGLAALLLFAVAVAHGRHATAALGEPPAELAALRWEVILMASLPLLLGAMVLLPLAAWSALIARALWIQLRAARRAALRARSGEFAREDWVGFVPDMRPGQPVYEAMHASAPLAHHERARTS